MHTGRLRSGRVLVCEDNRLIDIVVRQPVEERATISVLNDTNIPTAAREYAADILIKPVRYPTLVGSVAAVLDRADRLH